MGNLVVFNCLIRNPKVDLSIANKDELTPLDLSWVKIPRGLYYQSHPRVVISRTLLLVGAPAWGSRSDLFHEKYIGEIDVEKKSQDLANTTQAMGIVCDGDICISFHTARRLLSISERRWCAWDANSRWELCVQCVHSRRCFGIHLFMFGYLQPGLCRGACHGALCTPQAYRDFYAVAACFRRKLNGLLCLGVIPGAGTNCSCHSDHGLCD